MDIGGRKITKEQTALAVIGIAGILGLLFAVNMLKLHPILGLLLGLSVVGVVVGVIMYNRNKEE